MKTLINNNPLLIDTDPGHDDVLAIMLAVKSGNFDIRALTTVAGNSTIENVTRNAAYTLDLLGRRDIPIYSGSPSPLKRPLQLAVVHGESGLAGADTSNTDFQLTGDAHTRIIDFVESCGSNATILTLGALTNIARALIERPELVSKISRIVMMGGAIDVPGNKNRVAEFNFVVDPEAADIVFRAPVEKYLIPIDICNDMLIPAKQFDALQGSSLYSPIKSMMQEFIEGIAKDEGTRGALVYDAVAAYFLLNPKAFNLVDMDIVIETEGKHTYGMTVAERRLSKYKKNNVHVAMKVDKGAFIKDFFEILKNE